MFWRCISYSGVATLVEIEGNINSARYVEILEQNSWSVVENYFSERPCHRIFHDDSSAVQDSGFMVQWKGQNSVPCLIWAFTQPRHQHNRKYRWRTLKVKRNRRAQDFQSRAALTRLVKGLCLDCAVGCTRTEGPCITRFQTESDTFAGQMDAQPDID